MSGRRGGRAGAGRGNVNMTTAELNALIAERVAEAIAAHEAARNQGPQGQGGKELPNPNYIETCFFVQTLTITQHTQQIF